MRRPGSSALEWSVVFGAFGPAGTPPCPSRIGLRRQRHDLALMLPFHCAAKSETGGDMNVDPSKGIGRALFAALTQFAERSGHQELASAKLILLGFSGTGSLVGRFAEYSPDRVLAVIAGNPGHGDPMGVDTITLSPKAVLIPQLVLAGSDDRITGTQRPYAYFRKYFDQGGPWTFVVQNKVPHCCIINAKALVLQWLDAVVVRRLTRSTGSYGFIKTRESEGGDCPKSAAPIWCRGPKDTWGGANWLVSAAGVDRRPKCTTWDDSRGLATGSKIRAGVALVRNEGRASGHVASMIDASTSANERKRVSHANGAGRRGPASERVGESEGRSPSVKFGAPGGIRTPDLRLRRPALYPTELRARMRSGRWDSDHTGPAEAGASEQADLR
jgi:hypothetical protein